MLRSVASKDPCHYQPPPSYLNFSDDSHLIVTSQNSKTLLPMAEFTIILLTLLLSTYLYSLGVHQLGALHQLGVP